MLSKLACHIWQAYIDGRTHKGLGIFYHRHKSRASRFCVAQIIEIARVSFLAVDIPVPDILPCHLQLVLGSSKDL